MQVKRVHRSLESFVKPERALVRPTGFGKLGRLKRLDCDLPEMLFSRSRSFFGRKICVQASGGVG
jgi:hypothetical protein